MHDSPSSPDPAAVQARLRKILHALLAQNRDCAFESPDAIPDDVDLSTLGITSIDFLEFALAVEQDFQLAILDNINPNELPQTLTAWAQQVMARLPKS
jgi:acyl carrier protein